MKILVVSDTHGNDRKFFQLYKAVKPVDMVIHCGDIQGSEDVFSQYVDCAFAAVAGNNDFFSQLPKEREFKYGGKKFFVTHGHYYSVSSGYHCIVDEAKSRGCDFALFGHTHMPFYQVIDGIHVVNPGSISYPRQYGHKSSYAMIDVDSSGDVLVELKEIDGNIGF